ncbi:MAG: 7-carboxy-7-deazaguanine synthase QueE [Flavobacteriaceae bacterium]|jgi:7-carboxy-7-deazaguanine synthase|nr:7-carboxy-7-deazaguanine synthase QueE [Flavobacteriaceae bacterium]MBT4113462.1 7-carboxy-7-deazaguanine synthase QueE [Flavobacteriaceae bacterium]MBT4613565.1 7-carboxy-7-deazaguanine synthase QueE [Flavobacteriaceae bacterium]MBT5245980.1 7-carboxy-7-deazaguanine synthase QueE [Flavobacteriaceae bacterium]MBT5650344.1 7-carboxy-7-deazaguanine synthase QueE [Flavobacteriaceae bacterium]
MDKNTQELLEKGEVLPLMEAFYTIQGEGFHKGKASYFIRIGGCDVGCHWCDVKESWDAQAHSLVSTEKIIKDALEHSDTIVITGGEPLMWDMTSLTKGLRKNNKKIHIETSGAYELTGDWDWICLSPKKRKNPVGEIYKKANELKVIIYNTDDLKFAEQQAEKTNSNAHLFLQPEWGNREKMMPVMVDYVKKNPKWKISLQSHKYLNIP